MAVSSFVRTSSWNSADPRVSHRPGRPLTTPGSSEAGSPPDPPSGQIAATGPRPLVVAGVLGLVLGWGMRPLTLQLGYAEPRVALLSVALLLFAAAIVGATALLTRRTVRRDRFALAHHQAVNRVALGKACALVGAFLAGGYLGYAVAQLGVADPGASTRLWHAGLAVLAATLLCLAALQLEQACRVPDDPD